MRKNLLDMLSSGDRARVLALGRARHVAEGEEIIRQGTLGDQMFVVEAGEFAVVRRVPGDEEQVIGSAAAGTVIGELAALDRGPRAASLRALRKSTVRVIDARAFETFALDGGEEGFRVLRTVATSIHLGLMETRDLIRARLGEASYGTGTAPASVDWRSIDEGLRRLLGVLPAFRGLGSEDLDELAERMLVCTLSRGADFELQPGDGEGVTVVLRGAMTPLLAASGGRALALPAAGPGEFADYADTLELGATHFQTWRARSTTRLALLPKDLLSPGCRYGSRLLYALSRSLATTSRRTTGLAMHLGMDWAVALLEEEALSATT